VFTASWFYTSGVRSWFMYIVISRVIIHVHFKVGSDRPIILVCDPKSCVCGRSDHVVESVCWRKYSIKFFGTMSCVLSICYMSV